MARHPSSAIRLLSHETVSPLNPGRNNIVDKPDAFRYGSAGFDVPAVNQIYWLTHGVFFLLGLHIEGDLFFSQLFLRLGACERGVWL